MHRSYGSILTYVRMFRCSVGFGQDPTMATTGGRQCSTQPTSLTRARCWGEMLHEGRTARFMLGLLDVGVTSEKTDVAALVCEAEAWS